ncbi:MAG: hypothetical protein R2819_10240 [Allomuricauda sp.]
MNISKSNLIRPITLLVMFSFFGIQSVQSQIRVGVNGGIPIGDADDLSTFAGIIDFNYLFDVTDNLRLGPSMGYSHSFGDELDTGFGIIKFDETRFLPIYGAARFEISHILSFGADLGYALSLEKSSSGGFYYSPGVSLSMSDYLNFVIAYRGISLKTASWDIISFGLELKLK